MLETPLDAPDEHGPFWAVPRALSTKNPATRRRLSGPGLRTFVSIADDLDLGIDDRLTLLGEPPLSTYNGWIRKAHAYACPSLPLDTLTRISGVLGVYKAIHSRFPVKSEAMTWLKGAHHGEVFGGQPPITVMIGGGLDGILTVRRYLDGMSSA